MIHGILPGMLAHRQAGPIVNMVSLGGHVAGLFRLPYRVSKLAVVAICEVLHHEMTMTLAVFGVSVLFPGWVSTDIPCSRAVALLAGVLASGLDSARVAELAEEAVREGRFYVFKQQDSMPTQAARAEWILAGDNPGLSGLGI